SATSDVGKGSRFPVRGGVYEPGPEPGIGRSAKMNIAPAEFLALDNISSRVTVLRPTSSTWENGGICEPTCNCCFKVSSRLPDTTAMVAEEKSGATSVTTKRAAPMVRKSEIFPEALRSGNPTVSGSNRNVT